MNNKTAFGTVIGSCDNCRRLLYEDSTRYWVRFNCDQYCFCDYCVQVVKPEPPKEEDV